MRLLQAVKSLWVVLVFGGALAYFALNADAVLEQLKIVRPGRLMLAVGLLILGKLMLVELARQSVEVIAQKPGYGRMFYINAMSQLAKYLPGGVWHFVGRAGYYHTDGLTLKQATQAMVIENIWLVTSAAFVGVIFFIGYTVDAVNLLMAAVLVLCWWAMLYIMTRWRAPSASFRQTGLALLLQVSIWMTLGASLWVLIPQDIPGLSQLAIGAFGLSWVVGYVAVFAPSGLGVREGMLVAVLAVVLSPSVTIIYAAINRTVWIITEFILAAMARSLIADETTHQPIQIKEGEA
jgi:glycosyltransferase 2 family protein